MSVTLSTEERRSVLEFFGQALDREAHNLSLWPGLLWQQVYNRLQWEDEPVPAVLDTELQHATAPWMRTRTPSRESKALLRTLAGHSGEAYGCAVSPDGAFVLSASEDGTLKLWDPASGEELRTLAGHGGWVRGCAVSPDGAFVLSASADKTLRLWDAASGQELRTLEGHSRAVTGCAVSPDGAFVVSASEDTSLKLWDAASGEELRPLAGYYLLAGYLHSSVVEGCAVSPDGAFVLSASWDGTLKLSDAASGWAVSTVPLLGQGGCVALHPWLPLAACGDSGGSLYLLDLVGIEYGPIIVTALDRGAGSTLRCPACWIEHALRESWLGAVIECPTPSCHLQLRVNPFIAQNPFAAPR